MAERAVKFNYSTDLKVAWAAGVGPSIRAAVPPEPVAALRDARTAVARMAMDRWLLCVEGQ